MSMTDRRMLSLNAIAKTAENELIKALNSMPGDKVLILDDQIIGPLSLIAPSSVLKEHGVKKIYKLNDKELDLDIKNVLYIVHPRMHLMKWIGNQVKRFLSTPPAPVNLPAARKAGRPVTVEFADNRPKNFSIFMVPRKTLICEKILEEIGVYGDVRIEEYPLDLIPFDEDVLSMELPYAFKECQLDGDMSSLYYVAKSIMKIQSFYGLIQNVKIKGDNAKSVFDMMLRMRKQVGSDIFKNVSSEIDTLILIDRKVDMISPMLTQFTYEGLIDELFGIKNGLFQPDFPCVPDVKIGQKPRVLLKSTDSIFAKIRDLNQQFVGAQLNIKAKEVEEQMNRRTKLESIKEIKEFTKILPQLQEDKRNLEMHINILKEIKQRIGKLGFKEFVSSQIAILEGEDEDIEKYISKQEPLVKVLRLLCLMSLTKDGIPRKKYDFYKTEIVQSYGFEALLTLKNLEKLGLFCADDSKLRFNWSNLKKPLNLYQPKIMDDRDLAFKDIRSVHNGYAPLSVALIEGLLSGNNSSKWGIVEDMLSMLPGAQKSAVQKGAEDISPTQKKVVLVYFIGGVTFAEISAIRYLNEKRLGDRDYEFIIATTKLINGTTFLESLIEDVGTPFKKRAVYGVSLLDESTGASNNADDEASSPATSNPISADDTKRMK
jgi:hypothetical protein